MPDSTNSFAHTDGQGGTWLSSAGTWVDEVIAAGGVTIPAASQDEAATKAETLDAIVSAGGTVLPDAYEQKLSSLVDEATAIAAGDIVSSHGGHNLADRADAISAHLSDTLSLAVSTPLTALASTLDSAYLDGTISTGEQTSIVAAAAALDVVLSSDGTVKLSDATLTTLSATANDLHTLATTGFLPLDNDQLAAFIAFDSVYTDYLAGTGSLSDVKAARGDIGDVVDGYVLALAGDGGGGHDGWGWH